MNPLIIRIYVIEYISCYVFLFSKISTFTLLSANTLAIVDPANPAPAINTFLEDKVIYYNKKELIFNV